MPEDEKPKEVDIDPKDLVPDEGDPFGEHTQPEKSKATDETSAIRKAVESKKPSKKAFVEDQVERYPDTVKRGKTEVIVLDLDKPDNLEKYGDLKTQSADPDLGLTIALEDLKYNTNTNNWKVLLHLVHYHFYPVA